MGLFDFLKRPETGVAPALEVDDEISAVSAAEPQSELDERFTDEGQIARGGMGTIRRVVNRNLLRREAMKVLDPRFAHKPDEIRRFLEEAQITGQLDHPNIPAVHEVGEDESGAHFFTMKLVRGQTLEQRLTTENFDIHDEGQQFEVLQIFIKVCEAIGFAHSRGVVHCDLKPANVMIGSFGQVFVMDWGIARVGKQARMRVEDTGAELVRTASGRDHSKDQGKVMGTLAFMSPEQAHGHIDEIDERSDVFALGALLYRILTGRAPHAAKTPEETWALAKQGEVADPQAVVGPGKKPLPPRLCRVAMKAVRHDKDRRYPTVAALQKELEEYVRGAGRYPMQVFAPGERIITEGERGDQAYVVVKGQARVFREEPGGHRTLRHLGEGEVFGEAAILTDRPRTASVEATEELTVVRVSREGLEREMGQTFWVGHILKALAARFRDVDERLERQLHSRENLVAEKVLRYVAFHGSAVDANTRSVKLSELLRHLKRELKLGQMEAVALCSGVKGLRVNERADEAMLVQDEAVRPPTGATPAVMPRGTAAGSVVHEAATLVGASLDELLGDSSEPTLDPVVDAPSPFDPTPVAPKE
jgi:CRP-like cAMP-binding protein/tRNA A-37 threonylcarbamoyl transferase component Bud32